jgi:hypothetical protein
MADDYTNEAIASANRQLERLDTQWLKADAQFREARLEGDEASMDYAIQERANIEQQKQAIYDAYNRGVAAYYANMPRQPTREELNAMPLERMTEEQRHWWFSQQSRHGFDNDAYAAGKIHVYNNPSSRQR